LTILEGPGGFITPPPASASPDQRAAALLRLSKRAGIDPASAKPWEGVQGKFHHLNGPLGNHFADRLASVLLVATMQALRDGGDDASDPVVFPETLPRGCAFIFESQLHWMPEPLVLVAGDAEVPPVKFAPWRQTFARFDRLPAGHSLLKAITRDECYLSADAERVVLLGAPHQQWRTEAAGGYIWVAPRWTRVADAIAWTRLAERQRLDALAEKARKEREDFAERKKKYELTPEGQLAALKVRVAELEAAAAAK
jgi:hypothetical protein